MKNKKTKTLIFILCVLIIAIIALYFVLINAKSITGTIEYTNNAQDNEFGISVESPILYKDVEMVQYYKNENGEAEMVFANYQLDSFDNYINPAFPEDITSEVFLTECFINGYKLTQQSANDLMSIDDYKIVLEDLKELNTSEYVISNNSYVTPSNEWEIGDIRITYYYLDTTKTFDIKATISNKEIQSISVNK